jgi:UDP-2,3-diacylglucosamine pyrophosphatase LpxH
LPDEVIYFVSDTHLGDGTGADRFQYPRQLLDLLARIEAEPRAHLVLLGDFMELWAATLEPVLIRHAPVFYALGRIAARHPVTYVVGNHDCLPWYYFVGKGAGSITVTERFTAARGALVALHGHQFDPFNRIKLDEGHVKTPWTRRLVQAVGLVGRVAGDGAGDALADVGTALETAVTSLENVLNHESPGERGYPEGETVYEDAARRLMRSGARYVVMGHTHHPLTRQYGDRVYVNSGSWVWDRYPPTYARFTRAGLALIDANTHQPYSTQ